MLVDSRPEFTSAPESEAGRLVEIAEKKRAAARTLYDDGYRAGVNLFEKWPWELIDWASQLDFNVERLAKEDEEWGDDVYPDGRVEDDLIEADGWRKGKLFALGRRQALQDAWAAVVTETSNAGEPAGE